MLTLNVNSWQPFKERWANEGATPDIQSATVMLLQEHHLVTELQCRNATEWWEAVGWQAVFRQARTLDSGKSSGGVAI